MLWPLQTGYPSRLLLRRSLLRLPVYSSYSGNPALTSWQSGYLLTKYQEPLALYCDKTTGAFSAASSWVRPPRAACRRASKRRSRRGRVSVSRTASLPLLNLPPCRHFLIRPCFFCNEPRASAQRSLTPPRRARRCSSTSAGASPAAESAAILSVAGRQLDTFAFFSFHHPCTTSLADWLDIPFVFICLCHLCNLFLSPINYVDQCKHPSLSF